MKSEVCTVTEQKPGAETLRHSHQNPFRLPMDKIELFCSPVEMVRSRIGRRIARLSATSVRRVLGGNQLAEGASQILGIFLIRLADNLKSVVA